MSERHVLLLDMNAFFASIEQACNPYLQGKPVLVCGNPTTRTIVTAASYEARPFGIKSGMPLAEALRLCPQAVLIEGDPPKYIDTARRLQDILVTYTPLVEIFSIDEAFLELPPRDDPLAIARAIKADIAREFGLTCSIGIGPNKLLAKLAAGMEKPDGLVWIKREDIPRLFELLPTDELPGIGPRTADKLKKLGLSTLGDLGRARRDLLIGHFGRCSGELLFQMGRGEDRSPVVSCFHAPEVKSMGHSYTLAEDTWDLDLVRLHLLRLSLMVGRRLRADNYCGRIVRLILRLGDFETIIRQHVFKGRFFDHGLEIYQGAQVMLARLHLGSKPVRMVGVGVADLVQGVRQAELSPDYEKRRRFIAAEDSLLDRFGEFVLRPAALVLLAQRKEGKWTCGLARPGSSLRAGSRRFILTG